jgi:hypothetical protein
MRLIILHDLNNPAREVPIDAGDYSSAVGLASGSAVRMKSSDAPLLVAESPEEIVRILES